MGLNAALAGKKYPKKTHVVTVEGIERYARATNDLNDRYFGEDAVASPIFPIVPVFGAFTEAVGDPELEADLLRLVHGEQEHVLYHPIRPGDVVTIMPALESVEKKDTGETFTLAAAVTNEGGKLVAEVRGTMFIRGSGPGRRREQRPDEGQPDVIYEETTKVDEDQPRRYAEASGDFNPIHLDENVARMAGLPRTILHGMCTMAIATKGAVNGLAGGDPTRVTRVGVRFSRPVIPGEELTTRFWKKGSSGGAAIYGFETLNPGGAAVIRNGFAEITQA